MKTQLVALMLLVVGLGGFGCSQKLNFDLPETADNFGQNVTYNKKVDLLWVMDNSASMDAHQQRLIQQVPDLVSKLNSLKLDYRIFVITTDMGYGGDGGRFIGETPYVTAATPNLVAELQSRMSLGEQGDNLERGLESLERVVSNDLLSVSPSLRADAFLVVNVLSNEDDKSAKTKTSAPYAQYYSSYLDSVKKPWVDGSRSWMMNFIGVLGNENGACTTFQNYSEAGMAFLEMVQLSGGVRESICKSSLATAVSNVRARILEILTEFKLSRRPVVSTIVVTINGVSIPASSQNGWVYSADRNSIKFYGTAVPAADAKIRIDFKPSEAL